MTAQMTQVDIAEIAALKEHAKNDSYVSEGVFATLDICTMVLDQYGGERKKVDTVQSVLHLLLDHLKDNEHQMGLEAACYRLSREAKVGAAI